MSQSAAWRTYGDWESGKVLTVGPWELGLYHPAPESAEFWQGVREHRLLLRRCQGCGRHHHPSRLVCFDCDSSDLEWVQAAGDGVVYSITTIYRDLSGIGGELPYTVGIVRLSEGVHLFTRFTASTGVGEVGIGEGGIGEVGIDDEVFVAFEELPVGFELPVFVKSASRREDDPAQQNRGL